MSEYRSDDSKREVTRRRSTAYKGHERESEGEELSLERRRNDRGSKSVRRVRLSMWNECFAMRMGLKKDSSSRFASILSAISLAFWLF